MESRDVDETSAAERERWLRRIRARVEKATPGPWTVLMRGQNGRPRCAGIVSPAGEWHSPDIVETDSGSYPPSLPDAEFIAHARRDIPFLLGLIDTLTMPINITVDPPVFNLRPGDGSRPPDSAINVKEDGELISDREMETGRWIEITRFSDAASGIRRYIKEGD